MELDAVLEEQYTLKRQIARQLNIFFMLYQIIT